MNYNLDDIVYDRIRYVVVMKLWGIRRYGYIMAKIYDGNYNIWNEVYNEFSMG